LEKDQPRFLCLLPKDSENQKFLQFEMTLLFITTLGGWGGSEPLWAGAARLALKAGHQMTICHGQEGALHPDLVSLESSGTRLLLRPRFNQPHSIPARVINRLLRRNRIKPELVWRSLLAGDWDMVLVSQGGTYCALNFPGLAGWLTAQPAPFVLLCQSNRLYSRVSAGRRAEARSLFNAASRVCFVAQENLKDASEYLAMELPKAMVVQNPVNLADLSQVEWPKANPAPSMACVARLETVDKGQDLLLRVLAEAPWSGRNFSITLYGKGPDESYLRELTKYHRLEQKALLAGHIRDVREVWLKHELLVLPSLSEGTPLSLIEAQLCGRPSLVTRVGGNADWVEDGVTGFIAEAPTIHHLRLALEQAWQARDRW
jgi:glycosyltransferase involved in cell wall biosynthesis